MFIAKLLPFANLFLHCCGEAGHGMMSLDYCLNFQAGVVILLYMLVNINFMNLSIDDLIHRAPFCLKFCLRIIIIFLSSLYNNQHMEVNKSVVICSWHSSYPPLCEIP